MNMPKIHISQNKQLDKETIAEFFEADDQVILDSFPEIVEVGDVSGVVEMEYREESSSIRAKIKELDKNTDIIEDVCETLSIIMDESWDGITEINIYVGISPIAPRFLDDNSFLLPHYHDLPILLNWSAHELTHFLYFKKFSKMFPNESSETYESPHLNWVLSEILAPVIDNDERMRNIIKTDSNIYTDWQEIIINGKGLYEIFYEIYKESKTFDNFIITSRAKYSEIDNKHQLTQKLTKS